MSVYRIFADHRYFAAKDLDRVVKFDKPTSQLNTPLEFKGAARFQIIKEGKRKKSWDMIEYDSFFIVSESFFDLAKRFQFTYESIAINLVESEQRTAYIINLLDAFPIVNFELSENLHLRGPNQLASFNSHVVLDEKKITIGLKKKPSLSGSRISICDIYF